MANPFTRTRPRRVILFSLLGLLLTLLIAALLLLSFGWSFLRGPLEQRLSAQLGRRVTIAAIKRTDHGWLVAQLAIEGVRIAQPDWVGRGDFVRVARATVALPILPLLGGQARPQSIALDGLDIHLIRRDATHANWKDLPSGKSGGSGLGPTTITNGRLRFDDYKRDHFFTATIAADDKGLRIEGAGTLIGRSSRIALAGAGLAGAARWPFTLTYRSPIANLDMKGVADKPLDIGHFDATAHAWGDDLKHLDLLVEAGVPGTAPVVLDAVIRHDRPTWNIRTMTARIGRSRIGGTLDVTKDGERTRLEGKVVADALDFDDLANAEGRARAVAKKAATPGRRLPDTKIDLSHLMRTDAHVEIDIRQLLFAQPSAFRAIHGTLSLDHGVLVAQPFTTQLERGQLTGSVRVTQKDGAPVLALDLRLVNGRIEAMASDESAFSGALRGRFLLSGRGETIRAALSGADGRFALVGNDGTLGRKTALLLGQDIGRGLGAKADEVAALRCGIGSFVVHGGKARPTPLLIDTSVARAEATGLIDLTDERIDLSLTGLPKQPSALRLSGPIRVTGALFAPTVAAPEATSTKGILKSIGRALGGKPQPLATDADCAGLAARALR